MAPYAAEMSAPSPVLQAPQMPVSAPSPILQARQMPVATSPFWLSGQPPASTLQRTPEPTPYFPDGEDLVNLLPDGQNPRPVLRPVPRPVRIPTLHVRPVPVTTVDPPPAVAKGAIAGISVGIGALCAAACGIAKKRSDGSSESTES